MVSSVSPSCIIPLPPLHVLPPHRSMRLHPPLSMHMCRGHDVASWWHHIMRCQNEANLQVHYGSMPRPAPPDSHAPFACCEDKAAGIVVQKPLCGKEQEYNNTAVSKYKGQVRIRIAAQHTQPKQPGSQRQQEQSRKSRSERTLEHEDRAVATSAAGNETRHVVKMLCDRCGTKWYGDAVWHLNLLRDFRLFSSSPSTC